MATRQSSSITMHHWRLLPRCLRMAPRNGLQQILRSSSSIDCEYGSGCCYDSFAAVDEEVSRARQAHTLDRSTGTFARVLVLHTLVFISRFHVSDHVPIYCSISPLRPSDSPAHNRHRPNKFSIAYCDDIDLERQTIVVIGTASPFPGLTGGVARLLKAILICLSLRRLRLSEGQSRHFLGILENAKISPKISYTVEHPSRFGSEQDEIFHLP